MSGQDEDKIMPVHENQNDMQPIDDAAFQKPEMQVQLKSDLDHLTLLQAIRAFKKTVFICLLAGFVATLDGYQYQLSGSIVANKGFIRQFAHGGAALNSTWVSTFSGIVSAGQVLGQFSAQWLAEWIGRKYTIFVIMAGVIVANIIESVAKEWYVWTVAKLIAGISIGAIQATLPVYISEQAPSQLRGFLVVAYSLWWALGQLVAAVVLQVVSVQTPYEYLTSVYTQFPFSAVAIAIFIFLPESPWWAVRKGKVEMAKKILQNKNGKVPGYDVDRELGIIVATIEQQVQWNLEAKADGFFGIFKGLNGKRFLIASWPKVLQQFVGLAVFSNQSSYFFQLAGYANPFQASLIIQCTGLLSTMCDAIFVDKIGRRAMTLIGFTGACAGVLIIAIVSCVNYKTAQMGSLLVAGGVIANFCNTFQSSTSYAYLTEIPEQRFRARNTGWGLAYCNMFAVLINFTLPLMLAKWNIRCTWLFVCLGVPGTILAYFIMPETMRRSPAEIQEMFVDRVPLTRWKGYQTAVERDLDARIALHQL